jgi:GR25 family glycosyltransferase involved in LPS biosynthesis
MITIIIIFICLYITFFIINYLLKNNKHNLEHFDNNLSDKFNGIDHILWINLDRSIDRKDYMNNLLSNISVPNTRISAVDGKNLEYYQLQNLKSSYKLSNSEKACSLSHIKAINYLKNHNINGNYFMVCEDDISFDNLQYFKKNLKTIIEEAPEFDILLIYKTYDKEFKNNYENWKDSFDESELKHISGAASYIISRNGIDKLCKIAINPIDSDEFIFDDKEFHVSDIYLYKNLDTYVYKYNYITTLTEESTIHNNHLKTQKKNNDFNLELIKRDIEYL